MDTVLKCINHILTEWSRTQDFLLDLVDSHSSIPEEDMKLWKAMDNLKKAMRDLKKEYLQEI